MSNRVVKMNPNRTEFVRVAKEFLGEDRKNITSAEIQHLTAEYNLSWPSWIQKLKESRGVYYLPDLKGVYGGIDLYETLNAADSAKVYQVAADSVAQMAPSAIGVTEPQESYVPEKFEGYVPWGNFNTVKEVIKSGIFYPMFITGLSGNGKTLMVSEVCSRLKREYVRANITVETDEDDLIGGFRLLNGETVWHDGPVVTAMKRGALLLLDEIDLASN